MSFTEEKLEQTVIDLFEAEGYTHIRGDQIHKEFSDVFQIPKILKRTIPLTTY